MTTFVLRILLQALFAFLIGTLVFDFFHYLFHKFLRSKYRILRAIGNIHSAHHRFFPASLKIDKEWQRKNLINHVITEYLIQIFGISLCLFFLHPIAVLIAAGMQTLIFIVVVCQRGIDVHHSPYTRLPSSRGIFLVSADYHALHHVYPNKFYGSVTKIFDFILGSGIQLKRKKIAMTGANGALGSRMKKLLEQEGAEVITFKYGTDYTYDDYEKLKKPLENVDILFLCHGSKFENAQEANCDSFIKIIEIYKSVGKRGVVPLEIWAVGSEIECHPCFGIKKIKVYANSKRNFAKKAHEYFHDREIQYRHLVHSAFISRMGPGLMTANFAAKMTLFLIKRDFKYVPVTYTGFAFINYLRFIFRV